MKKAKLLSLVLSMLMLVAMFAACGEKDPGATSQSASGGDASQSDTSSDTDDSSNADNDEIVTLKFYMWGPPIADQDRVQEKANEIIRREIGAEINLIPAEEFDDKMNMMINAAEEWDLAFSANWMGNYFENAASGAYLALDDYIDEYLPQSYAHVPEDMWDGVRVNGNIYGIINYQIYGVAQSKGIVFIEEFAEKSGFDYKALTDKGFFEAAKALEETYFPYVQANYPDMVCFEYAGEDQFVQNPMLFGFDQVGDNSYPGWVRLGIDGKPEVINQYESEEYAQYLDVMRAWYEAGYIRKDAATLTDYKPDRQAERIACTINNPSVSDISDELQERLGVEFMPHAPKGTSRPSKDVRLTTPIIPAGKPSETTVVVGAHSKNPEKAMQLIELINTNDELYVLLTLGELDVDYEFLAEDMLDDDGNVVMSKGEMHLIDGGYNFNWNEWQIGQSYSSTFTRGIYMGNSSVDAANQENTELNWAVDLSAQPSPVMGFTFDSDPVKTELANCSSVIEELLFALGSGSIDPEENLSKFIERLENAGASKIIEEKQKQIDEWWAANH